LDSETVFCRVTAWLDIVPVRSIVSEMLTAATDGSCDAVSAP